MTERLPAAAYSNGHLQHESSLMERLQFTPDDLAANRDGRLSAAQKTRLKAQVSALPLLRLLMASLPLAFVVMSLLTIIGIDDVDSMADPAAFAVLAVVLATAAGMGLLLLFLILRRWSQSRRSVEEGVVHSVEGFVAVESDGRRPVLVVEDESGQQSLLPVQSAAVNAFQGCERYRIYYLRLPKRIVSAECLDH